MPPPALPPAPQKAQPRERRRVAWAVTIALSLTMLTLPVGLALLLSAGGDSGSSAEAADETSGTRSMTDREARVVFHLRPAGSLGMRILRRAPRATLAARGRRVRVVCGSVSGLDETAARWPRGDATLRVRLPRRAYAADFCSLKRGGTTVSRVIFP